MNSSDWWAKEKEWSDSEGNRDRSSEKLGDAGPPVRVMPPMLLERMADKEGERERATTEGLREEAVDPATVGLREGGCCWRMR